MVPVDRDAAADGCTSLSGLQRATSLPRARTPSPPDCAIGARLWELVRSLQRGQFAEVGVKLRSAKEPPPGLKYPSTHEYCEYPCNCPSSCAAPASSNASWGRRLRSTCASRCWALSLRGSRRWLVCWRRASLTTARPLRTQSMGARLEYGSVVRALRKNLEHCTGGEEVGSA